MSQIVIYLFIFAILACICSAGSRQPRPQGFSLKKWVGLTHFLWEKPWGRGWDPDLEIGRGGGHPDPYIRGGAVSKKILLRPLGPQFSLKLRGDRPPGPLPPDPPLY